MSDQLDADTSTYQHSALRTDMLLAVFEPAIPSGEQLQMYSLERAATQADVSAYYVAQHSVSKTTSSCS
jgi:hypothetical protein